MNYNNVSNWYPPSKYIFKPIYKYLRRKTGNKYIALTLTYLSSIAMHGAPFIPIGEITPLGIFGLGCITIGGVGHLTEEILKHKKKDKKLEEIVKLENSL